jgi:hypothetical protein
MGKNAHMTMSLKACFKKRCSDIKCPDQDRMGAWYLMPRSFYFYPFGHRVDDEKMRKH